MTKPRCTHLDAIAVTDPPVRSGDEPGCAACLAAGRDDWVHLRVCMTCGTVGCCDSSPGQHASRHAAADGHPLLRSIEPGEDWLWCAQDEIAFRMP